MSFSRVNGSGWGVNDEVSSSQLNTLDIDHANALDKTAAGDTIVGVVILGSGGKVTTSGSGVLELANNDFVSLKSGHTSRTQTRALNMGPATCFAAGWTRVVKNVVRIVLHGAGTTDIANLMLNQVLPPNAELTQIDFTVAIATGHGALPTNQPNFILVKQKSDGTNTSIANKQMAAGTVIAYENSGNIQTVSLTGLTEVIDKQNYEYVVAITDENGTNAAAGNIYYAALLYWTITDVRGV